MGGWEGMWCGGGRDGMGGEKHKYFGEKKGGRGGGKPIPTHVRTHLPFTPPF